MQSTSCPWPRKLSHRCEPMKPAPPVTRYLAMVSSYRVVGKAKLLQVGGIVNVAPVENHRLAQQALDAREIRPAKFIPFGENEQSRCAVKRVVVAVRILDPITENLSRLLHRLGIKRLHPRARLQQGFDDRNRRSVAHIIGS